MDTRDLIERREELKEQVLTDFQDTFSHYEVETYEDIAFAEEEIQSWVEDNEEELKEIEAIDNLENEIGSEFTYGVTLIEEEDFEDYCEELVKDCGYISDDFPSWIEIDWAETTNNMSEDYSEVDFMGETYLYRV